MERIKPSTVNLKLKWHIPGSLKTNNIPKVLIIDWIENPFSEFHSFLQFRIHSLNG